MDINIADYEKIYLNYSWIYDYLLWSATDP